jgi:hypothetical protein
VPVLLLPRQGWDRPDRSPDSHATSILGCPRKSSQGHASVAPVKSTGQKVISHPGVHTVAGQRRILTCFPCIQHAMSLSGSHGGNRQASNIARGAPCPAVPTKRGLLSRHHQRIPVVV